MPTLPWLDGLLRSSRRLFSSSTKKSLSTLKLKGRSKSSQEWLSRQFLDPYVEKAHMLNYRCRSAFKLLEIDDKFKILAPGDVVVDCGAAPGSWTQVAVERTNALGAIRHKPIGMVFGLDLLHIHEIPGATVFGGMDFTRAEAQERLKTILAGRLVDCFLSDMAPNATGVKVLDQDKITDMANQVLRFAVTISAPKANLVLKVWDNGGVAQLEANLRQLYANVKRAKPHSSRKDSSEQFLVARGFQGCPQDQQNSPTENSRHSS